MFEGWENFYLIVGPSAAALIGLMFVVVTLTAGRDREQTGNGQAPLHLAHRLAPCGRAASERSGRRTDHRRRLFGAACGLIAVIGLVIGVRSSVGIWRERITGPDSIFDMWWYGIIPAGPMSGWAVPRPRPSRSKAGAQRPSRLH